MYLFIIYLILSAFPGGSDSKESACNSGVSTKMWRKGNPHALLLGMQIGTATLEKLWRVLKKLKIELSCDPAIPLLGIYPMKTKTLIRKEMFTAALLTIVRIWKQSKHPSVDEWIKKMWYVYKREYYSVIKKDEILTVVATCMDLEGIMISEINQIKINTV